LNAFHGARQGQELAFGPAQARRGGGRLGQESPRLLDQNVAKPGTVTTDGRAGFLGLDAAGYTHELLKLSATCGDTALRLPAIYLVFDLARHWLLGTHQGTVSKKHMAAYLDEFVFHFNCRTVRNLSPSLRPPDRARGVDRTHHLPCPVTQSRPA
jgi:transposase-like protein